LVSSRIKSDLRKGEIPANPILGLKSCGTILGSQDSIEIRKIFQREAIAMISENAVFGVGAGAFGDHSCFPAEGIPHNTILHVFAELEVLGGLPFVGVLVISVMVLFRAIRESNDTVQPSFLGVLMLLGLHTLVVQVQGNYLFAIGFYIFVGVTAAIHSKTFYLER
jgi:O-antigen ligase